MTSADPARDDALAWLTGRLRWERLLTDLHRRSEVLGDPVAMAAPGHPHTGNDPDDESRRDADVAAKAA